MNGGRSSGLDSETDRKSAATQRSAHSCCQPFDSAPVTLTDAEREAVEWCVEMATIHATDCDDELAALRKLLERLK